MTSFATGRARTTIPQSSQTNRIPFTLENVFLQLDRLIDESSYTIEESASFVSYRIPFHFIIPTYVKHRTCAQLGNDTHANLPPTLGDSDIPYEKEFGGDMMPTSGQITYRIHASALLHTSTNRRNSLLKALKPLHVVPTKNGESTGTGMLNQAAFNKVQIKRGAFRKSAGEIHISSYSPMPIHLPMCSSLADKYGTTSIALDIEFASPRHSDFPPHLSTLSLKLVSHTSLGVPSSQLHSGLSTACFDRDHRCHFTDATNLPKMDVGSVQWRDISNVNNGPLYAARLIVPVVLPKTKVFVSDFESCVVSRSYSVDLSLSYRAAVSSFATSSIPLRVPVSIQRCVQ